MTKAEIKIEIQKALENVPENILQEVLEILKNAKQDAGSYLEISHSLRQILAEDRVLLEKLAK